MPLFFLFFWRNSSYSSPPGPNKHLASHTAQPGSLPMILQQTLHLGQGFSCPGPCAGSRDLIVLKHSSYHLIFQCPLSSYMLEYCWLFALFLISARCFTGAEGKWTPLLLISSPSSHLRYISLCHCLSLCIR